MRTRKTWEMTWFEIKEGIDSNAGIIIPIGATEQHGPHLPIATDSIVATETAVALAEENNLLVALPITYTCKSRPQTGGGMNFIGTHGLKGQTFIDMLCQVIQGYMRHGFKRIVLLNGHMENSNFIYDAAYQAMEDGNHDDVKIVIFEMAFDEFPEDLMKDLFRDGFPGWGYDHAGIYETSMFLYKRPELVQFDRAVDDRPGEMVWYDVLPIPDSFTSESGCLWKTKHATPEMGKRVWEAQLAKLNGAIKKELPL